MATIDAAAVGMPSADIADGLNRLGQFDVPSAGMLIEDDVVRPLDGPRAVRFLGPVGGHFVALAGEPGNSTGVWASRDGAGWQELGSPIPPRAADAWSELVERYQPVHRPVRVADDPLEPVVHVDGPRARDRQEMWRSTDGRAWERASVLATRPQPSAAVIEALPFGYLGIWDDGRVRVSDDGRTWARIKRLAGIGRSVDMKGGVAYTSVTANGLFHMEDRYGPERVLWKLSVAREV